MTLTGMVEYFDDLVMHSLCNDISHDCFTGSFASHPPAFNFQEESGNNLSTPAVFDNQKRYSPTYSYIVKVFMLRFLKTALLSARSFDCPHFNKTASIYGKTSPLFV